MMFKALAALATSLLAIRTAIAETNQPCNTPYTGCLPDAALGTGPETYDFTSGQLNSHFLADGAPDCNHPGDSCYFQASPAAPGLKIYSNFYIMFGKVTATMKVAPGIGVVSSFVLMSDDGDEIDFEFLGSLGQTVQTNFFSLGDDAKHTREVDVAAPNCQTQYLTYTIEYTKTQIIFSVQGVVKRIINAADVAATNYPFPQSPMQVQIGIWSGGAATQAPGTRNWASGRNTTDYTIDYSQSTMNLKSVVAQDYSTGTQYKYNGKDATWSEIAPDGNGGVIGKNLPTTTVSAAGAITAAAANSDADQMYIPPAFGGKSKSDTSTQTGWPWVGTSTASAGAGGVTAAAADGWVVNANGKVMPANSGAAIPPTPLTFSSSYAQSSSASWVPLAPASGGPEYPAWNEKGAATTNTPTAGSSQPTPIGHDDQGYSILTAPSMSSSRELPGKSLSMAMAMAMGTGTGIGMGPVGQVTSTTPAHASACRDRTVETGLLGIAALAVGLLA